jgi:hypothetical protein
MTYTMHTRRCAVVTLGVAGLLWASGAVAQTPPRRGGAAGPGPPPGGAPPPARPAPSVAGPGRAAVAAPRPAPRPGEVETEPIRCWWKTDRTSVRVGERFGLVLTCGAIETGPESSRVAVTIQSSQLEGGAVQLTPFEVVSAVRRNDVVAAPWRYLEFEYSLRLLNDGFFGQDVNIPALTVTYNLKAPGASGSLGRDLTYVLPALPMRVLSLVPKAAGDIRDASDLTFAEIESRRFQSNAALVASIVAFAFAALLAVLALVRLARRVRRPARITAPALRPSAVLGGCLRALNTVKADVRAGGWTADAARHGLSALRVASAAALNRPVSQRVVPRGTEVREGQLAIRTGWLGRGQALVSAAVTAAAIADTASNGAGPRGRARATLDQLGGSLAAFTAIAYGRTGGAADGTNGQTPDATELDAALANGVDAVRKLRLQAFWPMRTATALARSVGLY